MAGVFLAAVILFCVLLSLTERVKQYRRRDKDWSIIGEAKASPLSLALANMIGVAGGIYLSLVILVTFLELELPAKVNIAGFNLEPLAAISITAAVLQPYFSRLYYFAKKCGGR